MLVVLVVFVFLRDLRTTLIPSVAVPVSLIGTFSVMYLAGYSVDNLSLMALAIATGFVVDDAIVVIENITRYLEQGISPSKQRSRRARDRLHGVLDQPFARRSIHSNSVDGRDRRPAVSRVCGDTVGCDRRFASVSLTTTPMMCARLLRAESDVPRGRFYRASERAFQWILDEYEATLSWVLRHQPLMLLVTLATVAAHRLPLRSIPKGFFPQQDTGRLIGGIQADQNTSFQAMSKLLTQFAQIVKEDPAVDNVIAFTGGGGTANTGRMFVSLKPLRERKLSADRIIGRLRVKLSQIPGATLFLQAVQDVRVGGRPSNAQYQYALRSEDLDDLIQWAPRLFGKLRTLPALTDVNSDQQNRGLRDLYRH